MIELNGRRASPQQSKKPFFSTSQERRGCYVIDDFDFGRKRGSHRSRRQSCRCPREIVAARHRTENRGGGRRLCPDVGGHFRAVVAHSQPGAARTGERTGGIGAYPSKSLLPARPRGAFLRPFAKPCFGQLLTAYVTFLQHIGKIGILVPPNRQQQQSARVKPVKQFRWISQNDLGFRGGDDEIYNPNCDRRRIDRNARFCSGYGGAASTTTRASITGPAGTLA